MLVFEKTVIYLNVTARIITHRQKENKIEQEKLRNFVIIPSKSNGIEFRTFPNEENMSSYPITLMASDVLHPKILSDCVTSSRTKVVIEMYDNGFVTGQLKIYINYPVDVKKLNIFINSSLKEKNIVLGDERYDYVSYMRFLLELLKKEIGYQEINKIVLFEAFSIIHPLKMEPKIDISNICGDNYELSIYEAAIRRMPDMSEARIDVARKEQKNLSSYKDDIIYVNYHNSLIYIEPNRKHIRTELYIELINQFKLYIAKLTYIQARVTEQLEKINSVPKKLKSLREESDWLDNVRFDFLKAKEEFENAIDIAAVRVSWFNEAAMDKFRIKNRQQRLVDDLTECELIISRRLSLLQERQLQKISTILAVVSIVITIIGVIITI